MPAKKAPSSKSVAATEQKKPAAPVSKKGEADKKSAKPQAKSSKAGSAAPKTASKPAPAVSAASTSKAKAKSTKKGDNVPAADTQKSTTNTPAAPVPEQPSEQKTVHKTLEPEVQLRRRKSGEEAKAKRDIRLKDLRKNKPQGQKVDFKRAERFVKDFRDKERDRLRFKRAVKTLPKTDKPDGEQVLLAIRTTPIKKAHPKTSKILQMLRLKNVNTAVFLKANQATHTMLKLVEPYVSWGKPTLKTIKELIFKRGFARVEKKKVPISNNALIKQHLGEFGIICVEDIIHEISTGGAHFKEASAFLWPFKLSSPIVDRNKDEPIPGGNKEDKINEIAAVMN